MTKDTLFYLLIALIVGVSLWLFRVDKSIKQTQEYIAEQEQEPVRRTPAATPTQVERIINTQKTQNRIKVQTEKTSLEQRLNEERQRLEAQKQALDNLRTQNQEPTPSTFSTQIQEGSNELQNLYMELGNYDNAEREINRRADEIIRDQNSQAQVLRDRIDQDIRTQEDLIRQTQEQITFWQFNGNYMTEQIARLAEGQALLTQQQQQLENLKQQRLEISAQILENSRAVQAQKEQELGDLAQERTTLQSEMLNMNEELRRLQDEQVKQRSTQMSIGSQILQTQRVYQQQQERVRSLESALKQKNEELNLLTE